MMFVPSSRRTVCILRRELLNKCICGKKDVSIPRCLVTNANQSLLYNQSSCKNFLTKYPHADLSALKVRCISDDKHINESNDSKDPMERLDAIRSMLNEADMSSDTQEDSFDFDNLPKEEMSISNVGKPQRPIIDPLTTSVLLFPGQGSQFVGMCKNLLKYPNVKEMFELASEILRYNLKGVCLNGPKEELDQTLHCQPAVFVTSLAAVEKLKDEDPKAIENCVTAAGFSVGEYAALVFAGSLDFSEALHLIQVRAEAMQRASETIRSGMMLVVGKNRARYKNMCKEATTYCQNQGMPNTVCTVANYLYPDARVVAGNVEALDFIQERSKEFFLKFSRRLPVSGAFHTSLMEPASEAFNKALDQVTFETPVISVHSNVNGKVYMHPDHIKSLLKKQLTSPVKWEQTMHEMYERRKGVDFPQTYEVGPGKQLGSILQRVNSKAFERYRKVED